MDRLLASARKNYRLGTEALLDTLLRDVQRFAGTREFPDDVCLVAMDVRQVGVQAQGWQPAIQKISSALT